MATSPIGAAESEDCGYCFYRGDIVGYKWVNEQWVMSTDFSSGFSPSGDNVTPYNPCPCSEAIACAKVNLAELTE